MGILELTILILAILSWIGSVVLCLRKLGRSKIAPYSKIIWYVVIISGGFFGMVIFLIYHDIYLSRELRANF
jgi:hypothetical protein